MVNPSILSNLLHAESTLAASAILGALAGALVGGLTSAWAAYALALRMFRNQVLDQARKEIRGPMGLYLEWLTAVSADFALWKADLIPAYLPDSGKDQYELNRMRKLYVDPRNTLWLSRLEEYDAILPRFRQVIKELWIRQAALNRGFDTVFRNLETDPPEAMKAGEHLESMAFEQIQLVSDFLHQLQYECLRSIATRHPRPPRDIVKPRIIRTAFGRIKVVSPAVSY